VNCETVNKTLAAVLPMPARRMRIDLFDSEGNRYSISFEGHVTRDKAEQLLDLVELLGGAASVAPNLTFNPSVPSIELTKCDKVRAVVRKHFPVTWFSSREVQAVYEHELKEPISLSTVATYLARSVTKGLLLKTGPSNNLKYKLAPDVLQATPKATNIAVRR
jgi:hypothetical protein